MEGVIPIALSYKIIKNSQSTEESEKHLQTIDISSFIANEELIKEVKRNHAETDSKENLETKIRNKVMDETASERQAIIESAMLETEHIKEEARRTSASLGYDNGYHEGFQSGLESAKKETEEQRANAICMIEDAERKIKSYYEENEEKMKKK